MPRMLNYLLALSMAGTLAACGGGDSNSTEPGTGSISLNLTDAPTTEFSEVIVTFTGVILKPEGGERIELLFDEAKTIDLLTLQGGQTAALLNEEEVPAGDYNWVRLVLDVDNSYVMDAEGGMKTLFIPSGAQTGLKLIRGFTVAQGGQNSFTVDFDVRKSIVNPTGGQADYYLKPVLRIVDNLSVGSITGSVDFANINSSRMENADLANCTEGYAGAIYVYEGEVDNPTDLNVKEPDSGPLLVVPVEENLETGLYDYTAAFLTEGIYTISYTCEEDDNETSEELLFQGTQQVPVLADAETTAKTIPIVE